LLQVALPKKLALVLELEEDLPAVLADPSQLRQVMMNLVTNAAEAIGEREGTVTVRTSWRPSIDADFRSLAPTAVPRAPFTPDGWVVVEVTDDGSGMSEEVRARIFEPFYSTKGSGRGLGLATTIGILRTHEARLALETETGRGTSFAAAFPAMHHTTEPLPEPSASKSVPPAPDAKLRGRILLVDDEARARFALAFLLKNRGLEVLEASNGLEALEALAKDPSGIDAVVMDLSMPKMGGREAFAEMNASHPDLPVVLTSGYSAAERMASYEHREKVFAFLEKPFREEELFTLLTKAITKRRAR
jgi:CheY-like chemotaxis protein